MPDPRSQYELIEAVRKLNAREAERLAGIRDLLTSPEGTQLRGVLGRYFDRLNLNESIDSADGRLSGEFDVDRAGADAFTRLLAWHPALAEDRTLDVSLDVFGLSEDFSGTFTWRREASELMLGGALALSVRNEFNEHAIDALTHIAVGAGTIDTLLRRALQGKPDPLFDPPLDDYGSLFGRLNDLRLDLGRASCALGVKHALREFAQLGAWARLQADVTFRVWADGITALVPNTGYGGMEVQIRGAGFGLTQPLGVSVLFPKAGGGCTNVRVIKWKDDEIRVAVPEGAGDGYVGFVSRDPPEIAAINANVSAGLELAGVLEGCIGAAASRVADRLTHWVPAIPSHGCPTALASGANHFYGGPEILSVTPETGKQGDSITVAGNLFAPTDCVLMDGQLCATTFVSASELRFSVPAMYGGRHYVEVKHAPNHVSNAASFRVLPFVASANVVRAKPGSFVSLTGSGFAPGARVRLNDQEIGALVANSNSLGFTMFRPSTVVRSKAGEEVEVEVVLQDSTTSNTIALTLDTYHIVVFGDSIAWGQGLQTPQKFTSLVRDYIQSQLSGKLGVYLQPEDVFAHSGATIGRKPIPDITQLPALPGEVPTSYPTIYQQVDAWNATAGNALLQGEVELVLLDGGINDVNVRTVLFPLTSTSTIKSLTALHCRTAMIELLDYVAATFPNARIIITGFYPFISEQSDTLLLAPLLIAMGVALAQVNGAIVGGVISFAAKAAVVSNCKTFASEANAQLQLAVDDTNVRFGGNRIALAVPAFGPQNAALAPDSWLWEIDVGSGGITALDPVANTRGPACAAAGAVRTDVSICNVASIAHPNARGAQAYFEAIRSLL